MNRTCEKCIHYEVCRYPLEWRAFPDTCWKYEEERPHGEWIWKKWVNFNLSGDIICSECNFVYFEGASKERMKAKLYPFCPNCGASMLANDRQVTGKLKEGEEE